MKTYLNYVIVFGGLLIDIGLKLASGQDEKSTTNKFSSCYTTKNECEKKCTNGWICVTVEHTCNDLKAAQGQHLYGCEPDPKVILTIVGIALLVIFSCCSCLICCCCQDGCLDKAMDDRRTNIMVMPQSNDQVSPAADYPETST